MPGNDPNVVQVIFRGLFGNGNSSAITSRENEIILKKVNVNILEMEDVLFHLNSAVMMPENPKGQDSAQGGGASEEQVKVSGIRALGLVFKQFEFDSEVKMLISGHTDTSGTDEFNFKLSKERALNILYLLYKDDKDESKKKWADVCYNRQKVEDYQQILTYFEKKFKCGCDPKGIDDKWGDNTRKAMENFLAKIDWGNVKIKSAVYETNTDQKHRWSRDVWEAIYDLYSNELAEALEISVMELEARRKSSVKFVDDEKKIVACGESFPIDQKEKNHYRSQKNRRVEILFFDNDETPELTCPAQITKKHTEEECPLWRKFYFVPLYIDPDDLKAIVYHMQFMYYDRIKNKQLPVPEGLLIKAYENDHKEIQSETVYKNGVYFVKVKFKDKIKDPARTQFYFEVEAENKYCYTSSDNSDPLIATIMPDDFKKFSFKEKLHYYDLPKLWSSRNYFTRYDGDFNKGERFEKVFKDELKLKPLDNEITKKDKPLVFSLDDIVLVKSGRSQILFDKDNNDHQIPLDDNSRYTLFHIDYQTKENAGTDQKNLRRMKIYKPETDQPVFTDIKFNKNLITDVPIYTRIIYFCNEFYDVGRKRSQTTDTSFDYAKGHIAGARLAINNDPDLHKVKSVIATNASDITNAYALNGCGHYELHYLHECADLDGKPLNYLIIYWNCRLVFNQGGTAADVTNHRKFGMANAMERINKNYLVEKHSGAEDMFIRLFFFMEAKNDTNGGKHKCVVNVTNNNNGAWMMVNEAKFRSRDYQKDCAYFGNADPDNNLQDVDGSTYCVLTNHHEMGHATGNWDSYLYNFSDAANNNWTGLPEYDQPFTAIGGPYRFDNLARMFHNRTPRLRNFWKYVLWLNDESVAGKELNNFLKGTKYRITFQGKTHKHEFFLADKYRNVELASFSTLDYTLNTNHKVDVLLYKLGDDEFSILAKSGLVFNGILVVKIRLALRFINTPVGGNWDFPTSLSWGQKLNNEFKVMLDRKFRMSGDKENDFKNLFVVFTPSYKVYTGSAPADSQYNIEVSFQIGNNFTTNGKKIQVDWDTDPKHVIRYVFGKTTGVANLTKSDFPKIVNWVGSPEVANAAYTMHDF